MGTRTISGLLAAGALAAALFAGPADAATVGPTTIAVIGDTPYGLPAQNAGDPTFPNLITSINADPSVSLAMHLGDIKNGSTQCTDAYFNRVRDWFNGASGPGFADPLVFTPGDNEWTDCHRANNGSFVPTTNGGPTPGRLEVLRSTFYPTPGQTLGAGAPRTIDTQANVPGFSTFVENTRWVDSNVTLGMVHVVGSNNGALAWFTGAGQTPETPAQAADRVAEVAARMTAALAWIDAIFDDATTNDRAGVLLGMQADMWDTFQATPGVFASQVDAMDDIVTKIAQRSIAFGKPVLLLQGDSHFFLVDHPLDGSVGSATVAGRHPYNPTTDPQLYPPVTNLTRIVVPGSNGASPNGLDSWLKVVIDPSSPSVFSTSLRNVNEPPAVVPELPLAALASISALAVLGAVVVVRRRTLTAAV